MMMDMLNSIKQKADSFFYSAGEEASHHPYSEDIYLLIEISNSSLKKDLETKAQIYARNNIPEYWIIDLANRKSIVHTQPADNNYLQIVEYKSGTISPQAFPNVTIPLDRLLLF